MLALLNTGIVFADPVTIDFNDLSPGVILTEEYSNSGAMFSLIPSPTEPGSPLPPPAGPTAWHLGPVDQFGVNGNSILVGPTTTGPFYDVQLDFSGPADYFSILALDQDQLSDLRVQAYRQGQVVPLTVSATLLGDINALPYVSGPVYRVDLGQIGGSVSFDRVVFGGTEQFDNLAFNLLATCSSTVLTIAGLHAEVEILSTSPATREVLHTNLNNVQAALDKGNNKTARTRLTTFIQKLVNRSNFASSSPDRLALEEANSLVCGTANVLGGIPLQ
jgi:hypothetical protein